jgi:hypothetical protein
MPPRPETSEETPVKNLLQVGVLVSLVLLGCGLPPEAEGAPVRRLAAEPAAIQGTPPVREHQLPDRVAALTAFESAAASGVQVSGTGSFSAGLRMRVITGLMGCGFDETGRIDTITQPDAFVVTVPQKSGNERVTAVLVWVDLDQDGVCGPADLTTMISLGYSGGPPTGLDLSTGWNAGCYWFN